MSGEDKENRPLGDQANAIRKKKTAHTGSVGKRHSSSENRSKVAESVNESGSGFAG